MHTQHKNKKGKFTPPHSKLLKINLLCLFMSIFSISAFSQNLPNTLPDTGYVGVGTSTPTCNFQVVGTSQISGSLTIDSSITIADSANVNNNLRVSGNLIVGNEVYFNALKDTNYFMKILTIDKQGKISGTTIGDIGNDDDEPLPLCAPKLDAWGHNTGTTNGKLNIILCPQYGNLGVGSETPMGKLHVSGGNALFDEKVGIGTNTPSHKLHIATTGVIKPNILLVNDQSQPAEINYQLGQNLISSLRLGQDNNGATFVLEDNTKQGNDKYRLVIDGNGILHFREGKVNIPAFPDYVFSTNYQLKTISEVESYILQNGHLPNMPNADEVKENGIGIGELQVKLLEKIEELTLYIIQQQKEIDILKQQNKNAKNK
ncbi:MAG: hypothetical protein HJHJAOHD_00458 [Flavobacteriales bacterium]|nr:hypothetical protein [Flavobacteriales bacterium]